MGPGGFQLAVSSGRIAEFCARGGGVGRLCPLRGSLCGFRSGFAGGGGDQADKQNRGDVASWVVGGAVSALGGIIVRKILLNKRKPKKGMDKHDTFSTAQ